MSPRLRVWLVVAAAALAAAGTAVGVTLATRTHLPKHHLAAPPLADDPTASRPVVTEVRAALRVWPNGTTDRLDAAARAHPRSALVQLELGLARAVSGDKAGARRAWRRAARVQPDSPSAVYAENGDAAQRPAVRPELHERAHAGRAPVAARCRAPGRVASGLGRAGVRDRSEAGSGECGSPGRGRRRPLRQRPTGARVLPPRPARAPLPARADGAVPPRVAADLSPPASAGETRVDACAGRRA